MPGTTTSTSLNTEILNFLLTCNSTKRLYCFCVILRKQNGVICRAISSIIIRVYCRTFSININNTCFYRCTLLHYAKICNLYFNARWARLKLRSLNIASGFCFLGEYLCTFAEIVLSQLKVRFVAQIDFCLFNIFNNQYNKNINDCWKSTITAYNHFLIRNQLHLYI